MGVSALQHRIITGKYNCKFVVLNGVKAHKSNVSPFHNIQILLCVSLAAVGLILYTYILCLTMAMYVDCVGFPYGNNTPPKEIVKSFFIGTHLTYRNFINNIFLFFLVYLMKDTYDMHGVISIKRLHHKNIKGYGVFSYISNVYTYWIVSINKLNNVVV